MWIRRIFLVALGVERMSKEGKQKENKRLEEIYFIL